jgi:DNA-binding NtrC family response regulator
MPNNPALNHHRILVIEDEYCIAEALRQLLLDHGAEVIGPLATLERAMEQVRRDGFEIAILDVNLRGTSAFPIADELKRQNIPFVFITGYSPSEIPERFCDTVVWEKPFDENRLIRDSLRLCEISRQHGH